MSFGFTQIPASFRTFGIYVEHDNSRAIASPPSLQHVALVIAPQLLSIYSEGDVVPIDSPDDGYAKLGVGSIAGQMCDVFKRNAPQVPLYCAPLDDESGTAATGAFTFSGTATESRELPLYIGGRRIAVAVVSGDDAAAVETKAVAAAQAADLAATLPVTVAADGAGTAMNVTARHDGTFGNQIDLRVAHYPNERVPAGITVVVTPMSGGATDPAITDVLNALGPNSVYNTIVHPYIDATNLTSVESDMDARWHGMDTRRGHAFTAAVDTAGNLTTLGSGRNSPHNTIFGMSGPALPWEIAAAVAAADASYSDPAQPRRGTILQGIVGPKESEEFTRTQRDTLLHNGIATGTVVGGRILVERLATTYRVNGSSVPDPSYLDVNTLRTSEFVDFGLRSLFSSKYAKAKIAGPLPGQADFVPRFGPGQIVLTPSVARAEVLGLCGLWVEQGILERKPVGGELICQRNASDLGRMDISFSPDYMNQFRGMAIKNAFLL